MHPKPLKRASVTVEQNKTIVRINSSAISLLQTCQRKAKFSLFDGVDIAPGIAARFGSLIHKALEKYYTIEPNERTVENILQLWSMQSADWVDSEDSPHTKAVGAKILKNYTEQFKNDPWVAAKDSNGNILAETEFEFLLHEEDNIEYRYFGTIDLIVRNTEAGYYAIMDHKTGRSLGLEFINRWKPNNQVSGYVLAAQIFYGLPCNRAVINGLQVAKTVQGVCRVDSYRDSDELKEFMEKAIRYAKIFHSIKESVEPTYADGSTCSQYSGCFYQQICALTPKLRDNALKNVKLLSQPLSEELS